MSVSAVVDAADWRFGKAEADHIDPRHPNPDVSRYTVGLGSAGRKRIVSVAERQRVEYEEMIDR